MKTRPSYPLPTKSRNWTLAAAACAAGLSIIPAANAQIPAPGFTSAGTGPTQWTLNGSAPALAAGRPAITANELLITGPANDQATSAWYNTAQALSNFTANFTYDFISGTTVPADGFAFVVQNNSLNALGDGGGGLGYTGANQPSKSVALAFDLWNNNNATGITRSGFGASGYGGFFYSDTTPVALRDPVNTVNVNIAFRDGVFTEVLTQPAATPGGPVRTITKTFNINVLDRVGSTGFVGFTGGTGGANADQKLTNFSYTIGNAPAVAPAASLITGVPLGAPGQWGIREVLGAAGCCGDLTQAAAAITGTGGTRAQYNAPVVNLYDSDVHGQFLGQESLYKTDPDQVAASNDTVNNIAVIATSRVRIPTTGMYTFGSNSDDGFRLTIAGQRFEQAFGEVAATTPPGPMPSINANGALEFPNGRGGANATLGSIFLAAGDYDIQLLNWEGGGGASVELYASPGVKTAFDPATFNLVGGPAVTGTTGQNKLLGVGSWTLKEYTGVANVTDVLNAGRNGTGPGVQRGATSTVPTIRYHDPQGSNTGSHTADAAPFPRDTAADDDNYGAFATVPLTIAAADAGVYTFVMYTDDDSRFRILNGTTPVPLTGTTVGTAFDSDGANGNDQFGTDGCCADYFGHYNLAAGTYSIEAAFHEGGGGSGFFLYGTKGDRNTFDRAAFQLIGENINGANWNTNIPAGLQLVPEPGSVSLLSLGALGLLARRRRQQS